MLVMFELSSLSHHTSAGNITGFFSAQLNIPAHIHGDFLKQEPSILKMPDRFETWCQGNIKDS